MTIAERREAYVAACKVTESQREALDDQASTLQARIDKAIHRMNTLQTKRATLLPPSWVDALVAPLAEEVREAIGAAEWQARGPFGIGAKVLVRFYMPAGNERRLTIEPGNLTQGQLYVETGKTLPTFPPGTLGYINGLNQEVVPLPDSIDDVLQYVSGEVSE